VSSPSVDTVPDELARHSSGAFAVDEGGPAVDERDPNSLAGRPASKYLGTVQPAGDRRTQAQRRSRSEEALLDAAAQLIAERGVERASLASIGERAGVSRGLPTHHFGSKDTLVARLAERAQERIAMVLSEQHSWSDDASSGLDLVYTTVDAYLGLFHDPGPDVRALLVMWGSTFPACSSVQGMTEAERRSYDGLSEVILIGQEDGSIRSDADPTASAVLLLGMMRGIAALLLTDSKLTDMRRVRRTCRDWITSSLATRTA
jgi:AcrR family transcriptional regulator